MQITIIHPDHRSKLCQAMLSEKTAGQYLLDGLAGASFYDSKGSLLALPEGWKEHVSITHKKLNYYTNHLTVTDRQLKKTEPRQWLILSDGRYATQTNCKKLFNLLDHLDADVIAVNVRSELTASHETPRIINSSGNVAGFRRFYDDTAHTVILPDDWPHHLFIKKNIYSKLVSDDIIPLSFSELIQKCQTASLQTAAFDIAGEVLDLATKSGLLALIIQQINTIKKSNITCPKNTDVSPQARIFGKVILGQNVTVQPDAIVVGPAVIGDNVKIASGAVVRSSVIGAGKTIPENSFLQHSILLNGCDAIEAPDHIYEKRYNMAATKEDANNRNCFKVWPWGRYVSCWKRLADIVVAAIVLLLFAPVFPFIALAIKLSSSGPVFFGHKRQGLHGREFACIKFRTMLPGADQMQGLLRRVNEADGPQFMMEDDPRINSVGRFLRDTCLDEIPQFINVLLGQMSVVGPRPSPEAENLLCPPWRDARLSVRPGITGLWQVCRTRLEGQDFQEWVYYDTTYIRKISLKLDLWICWKTAKKLILEFFKHF